MVDELCPECGLSVTSRVHLEGRDGIHGPVQATPDVGGGEVSEGGMAPPPPSVPRRRRKKT